MSELKFPDDFLWGTATAAHQVEGNNSNSDWWEWELRRGSPCKEPSGTAIDHYGRYPRDMAVLKGLGFNTYRFSVEWSRIEPKEGFFDETQIEHYRTMVALCRKSKLIPMVTLNHFTLPQWVGERGGWLSDRTPVHFARYARRMVEAFGDKVDWYCTINEPGVVAYGGYLGALGFPPGAKGLDNWKWATTQLIRGHQLALAAIKQVRPKAMVGQTHAMQEWESNAGGKFAMEYARKMGEDVFLKASKNDDFIGVQTYTRIRVELSRPVGLLARAALSVGPLEKVLVGQITRRQTIGNASKDAAAESGKPMRRTQMGYEFRPQAVAATVSRVAELLPGKPIVVTEHGIATADDAERIEFITEGLKALHSLIGAGVPLKGYIHWSAFDNFEWAEGYRMKFGLIAVDRKTQERSPKPSARFLGDVSRRNRLKLPDSAAQAKAKDEPTPRAEIAPQAEIAPKAARAPKAATKVNPAPKAAPKAEADTAPKAAPKAEADTAPR
ncbi:MAG TPA: family 1 glycosylhydrolase [Candidatus Limnocylindrales bacterium]